MLALYPLGVQSAVYSVISIAAFGWAAANRDGQITPVLIQRHFGRRVWRNQGQARSALKRGEALHQVVHHVVQAFPIPIAQVPMTHDLHPGLSSHASEIVLRQPGLGGG